MDMRKIAKRYAGQGAEYLDAAPQNDNQKGFTAAMALFGIIALTAHAVGLPALAYEAPQPFATQMQINWFGG